MESFFRMSGMAEGCKLVERDPRLIPADPNGFSHPDLLKVFGLLRYVRQENLVKGGFGNYSDVTAKAPFRIVEFPRNQKLNRG